MKRITVLIKLFFTCGLLLILIGVFFLRQDDIVTIINTYFYHNMENVTIGERNEYYRDYNFTFVQNVEEVNPNSYQDLINIYYSIINSGQTSFSFYCPHEYKDCLTDVQKLANNRELLSNINNYVQIDGGGKDTVNIIYESENTINSNKTCKLIFFIFFANIAFRKKT